MGGFLCFKDREGLPQALSQFLCRQQRSCAGKCSLLQVTGSVQHMCDASLRRRLSSNRLQAYKLVARAGQIDWCSLSRQQSKAALLDLKLLRLVQIKWSSLGTVGVRGRRIGGRQGRGVAWRGDVDRDAAHAVALQPHQRQPSEDPRNSNSGLNTTDVVKQLSGCCTAAQLDKLCTQRVLQRFLSLLYR